MLWTASVSWCGDDPNLVLKRLSFAHRPLIQHLMQPPGAQDLEFVQGDYINEHGYAC